MTKKPRISVNKLAEYIEASPSRRKTIIKDAKYPDDFKAARYFDAREVIKDFYLNGQNEIIVMRAAAEFKKIVPQTPWQQQDKDLSLEALDYLLDIDGSVLEGCKLGVSEGNNLIDIAGVSVSVNPDLLITKKSGKTEYLGALKFHISKTNPLSVNGQKAVAALLHEYVLKFGPKEGIKAYPKLCLSIDIFQGRIECSPKAIKRCMQNIESACEEIALRWDSL